MSCAMAARGDRPCVLPQRRFVQKEHGPWESSIVQVQLYGTIRTDPIYKGNKNKTYRLYNQNRAEGKKRKTKHTRAVKRGFNV